MPLYACDVRSCTIEFQYSSLCVYANVFACVCVGSVCASVQFKRFKFLSRCKNLSARARERASDLVLHLSAALAGFFICGLCKNKQKITRLIIIDKHSNGISSMYFSIQSGCEWCYFGSCLSAIISRLDLACLLVGQAMDNFFHRTCS